MTAPAHSRTSHAVVHPASRLPWWALALPVLAFVALLTLLTVGGPSQADGSSTLALSDLITRLQHSLGG